MCLCQTLISFTFTDTNTNASLESKLNKCTRSSMRFLQNSKISSIASLFDFSNLLSTPRLAKSDSFLDSWTWSDQQTEDWDFRECAGRWQFFLQCDLLQNQGHTSSKNHDTETYYVEECLTALQCIAFVEIEMAYWLAHWGRGPTEPVHGCLLPDGSAGCRPMVSGRYPKECNVI